MGKSNLGNPTRASCLHSSSNFNTTRMNLHLIGEEEGQIRVLYVNVFNFIFWYNTANKTK